VLVSKAVHFTSRLSVGWFAEGLTRIVKVSPAENVTESTKSLPELLAALIKTLKVEFTPFTLIVKVYELPGPPAAALRLT
jgi:hypothetical protein